MRTRELTSSIPVDSANGSAVKPGADTPERMVLSALIVKAGFAGTALSFEASIDDGTTWYSIKNTSGVTISYTVAAGTAVSVPAAELAGFACIRPVSNANATVAAEEVVFIYREA